MTTLAIHRDGGPLLKPEPRRGPVTIRQAVVADMMFIDGLQKQHAKMVGWMPTKQLENYIKAGHVLIADSKVDKSTNQQVNMEQATRPSGSDVDLSTCRLVDFAAQPLGYLIARDQYFKRDDVGIIYQLNVSPGSQRGLIGAALLKAQFERSAWGCRLYCCWCAQDLEANYFWEAMGFVPLAFRAGSEKKRRVHIFWQKRIRAGDAETAWWFPCKTNNGAIREDRIVLPIPPGTHWSDPMPMLLPGEEKPEVRDQKSENRALTSDRCPLTSSSPTSRRRKKIVEKPAGLRRNGLKFGIPMPGEKAPATKPETKATRAKRACDPRHVAAARELRDRYLEQVNSGERMLPAAHGKYDVSRQLASGSERGPEPRELNPTRLLKAA